MAIGARVFLCCFVFMCITANSSGVKILPDVPEIVINAGDTFNLTCRGQSPLEWQINVYEPNMNDEKSVSNIIDSEEDGHYMSTLQIQNVYFLDTGYIYCFPEGSSVDSPDTAKIYLYVNDENHLLVVNNTFIIQTVMQYDTMVLPCRPTLPNVTVILKKDGNIVNIEDSEMGTQVEFDKKIGFIFHSMSQYYAGYYICKGLETEKPDWDTDGNKIEYIIQVIPRTNYVAMPYIKPLGHIVVGDNVTLDCSLSGGAYPTITWIVPNDSAVATGHIKIMKDTTKKGSTPTSSHELHKELIIYNVTKEDMGTYVCYVSDASNNTNKHSLDLKVFFPNDTFLNLSLKGEPVIIAHPRVPSIQWVINIESHPKVQEILWYNPKHDIIVSGKNKFDIKNADDSSSTKLVVKHPDVNDSGTYTLKVSNDAFKRDFNVSLYVKSTPDLRIASNVLGYYMAKKEHIVECEVFGYPTPKVEWYFKACPSYPKCENRYQAIPRSKYEEVEMNKVYIKSSVILQNYSTGELLCVACNQLDKTSSTTCKNETAPFLIIEVENGFAATPPELIVETDNLTVTCGATKYNYSSRIDWFYHNFSTKKDTPILYSDSMRIIKSETDFTYYTNLNIPGVSKKFNGEYKCIAYDKYRPKLMYEKRVNINVRKLEPPRLLPGSNMGKIMEIKTGKSLHWHCYAYGMPPPEVIWYKDDERIEYNNSRMKIMDKGQTLFIEFVSLDDDGIYKCLIKNKAAVVEATGQVKLLDKPTTNTLFWSILLGFIILVCVVVIAWLLRSNMKQRKFKREMSKAGLLHFEKGNPECINPELDLQDQADLLPYNKKWEFPRDKLKLGKQLGAGAFGMVLKAEALGLVEPDINTTVAVKMVKRNTDLSYIKALASELKIMSHLGKHLNVVNLLGACTDNLNNRELLVLVEYCRYGNLHQYLLKHRDTFINQLNIRTGEFEPTVIHSPTALSPRLKYADLSFSNGLSPEDSQGKIVTSDGSTITTPVGEDGYLVMKEPEWRSNYRGDYKGTSVRPICTQDLFCWGFQVARGMEYLASRKVLHGDLAARNILLADDNVVKICDFGFSKSMYKDESYHKKGDGPLPVKWMSIESIRDRVFSTQSDIWAFGIVLWEFFSLAKTPYPGMEADEKLLKRMIDGYRMDKPKYASNQAYRIMLECWHERPNLRPSFTELAERLGDLLENTVRSHYVDMNDPYLKLNAEFLAQEDYLSMLRAPTYSNWQPAGDEGYTSMKPSLTDAREAMELDPMLNPVTSISTAQTRPQSIMRSESSDENKSQGNNYMNVHQAIGFANPSYHNLGRPKLNPYVNVPTSPTERYPQRTDVIS